MGKSVTVIVRSQKYNSNIYGTESIQPQSKVHTIPLHKGTNIMKKAYVSVEDLEVDDYPYSVDIIKEHSTIFNILPDLYSRETSIDYRRQRVAFRFVLELSPIRVEH